MLPMLPILLLAAAAQARDWEVDASHSQLGFTATQQRSAFEGRFTRFTPHIRFDPQALEASRFEVEIDLGSVDTRNRERDQALADPAWFDSARFPLAHYRAEHFEVLGGDRFLALGELSIRGQTQPVRLEFVWTQTGDQARLEGRAELDRLDFGLGAGEWADDAMIGHRVEVHTRLSLGR